MNETIEVAVAEAEGPVLDWMMAQIDPMCEGIEWQWSVEHKTMLGVAAMSDGAVEVCAFLNVKLSGFGMNARMQLRREGAQHYSPSTDWSRAGPLRDQFRVEISQDGDVIGTKVAGERNAAGVGSRAEVAICRAIGSYKLGERVSVPAELANRMKTEAP